MGYDPFKLEEGMLDDVDVTFTNCRFEFNPDYQDGNVLVFTVDLEIDDDDYDEAQTKLYACGQGWTTTDKGKTAEREDGKQKNFNKRSAFGLLLGSIFDIDESLDVLRKRFTDGDLTPQHAALLEGLKFHMEISEIDYGGDIGKIGRLLATDFLGVVGEGKSSGGKKKVAATTDDDTDEEAPAPAKKKKAADSGIPSEVVAELDRIADESESHDEFMEAVFDQLDSDALTSEVEDAIKQTGDGSVWARAVERAE